MSLMSFSSRLYLFHSGVHGENQRNAANHRHMITSRCIEYISPYTRTPLC
jgi:hypothetical protein